MDAAIQSIPFDAEILSRTPPEVIEMILSLLERIKALEARVEELKAKLNENSSNSNKPPSSDPPFAKRPEAAKKSQKPRKRKGTRQQCLRPTELVELQPDKVRAVVGQLSNLSRIISTRSSNCPRLSDCCEFNKGHYGELLLESELT